MVTVAGDRDSNTSSWSATSIFAYRSVVRLSEWPSTSPILKRDTPRVAAWLATLCRVPSYRVMSTPTLAEALFHMHSRLLTRYGRPVWAFTKMKSFGKRGGNVFNINNKSGCSNRYVSAFSFGCSFIFRILSVLRISTVPSVISTSRH